MRICRVAGLKTAVTRQSRSESFTNFKMAWQNLSCFHYYLGITFFLTFTLYLPQHLVMQELNNLSHVLLDMTPSQIPNSYKNQHIFNLSTDARLPFICQLQEYLKVKFAEGLVLL